MTFKRIESHRKRYIKKWNSIISETVCNQFEWHAWKLVRFQFSSCIFGYKWCYVVDLNVHRNKWQKLRSMHFKTSTWSGCFKQTVCYINSSKINVEYRRMLFNSLVRQTHFSYTLCSDWFERVMNMNRNPHTHTHTNNYKQDGNCEWKWNSLSEDIDDLIHCSISFWFCSAIFPILLVEIGPLSCISFAKKKEWFTFEVA